MSARRTPERDAVVKQEAIARINAWSKAHPERTKERIKKWKRENRWRTHVKNLERKQRVIDAYGGKCAWVGCEVTDIDMLTIDHTNNDGAKERKELGHVTGSKMYRRLESLNFPEGYQPLCANHNLKKEIVRQCEQRKS